MNQQLVAQSDLPRIVSTLAAHEDVFVCRALTADEEATICVEAVRHGSGVVLGASSRRLRDVGARLQGRRLRITHVSGERVRSDDDCDVTLLPLRHAGSGARPYRWALVLDDVLTPALLSYAVRSEMREVLSYVDSTCVCVDVESLCQRLAGVICLDPEPCVLPMIGLPAEAAAPLAPEAGATDALFEILREWRKDEARRRKVPAFRVLSDRTLRFVCAERPADLASLSTIPGIGVKTIEEHGPSLLAALVAAQC